MDVLLLEGGQSFAWTSVSNILCSSSMVPCVTSSSKSRLVSVLDCQGPCMMQARGLEPGICLCLEDLEEDEHFVRSRILNVQSSGSDRSRGNRGT